MLVKGTPNGSFIGLSHNQPKNPFNLEPETTCKIYLILGGIARKKIPKKSPKKSPKNMQFLPNCYDICIEEGDSQMNTSKVASTPIAFIDSSANGGGKIYHRAQKGETYLTLAALYSGLDPKDPANQLALEAIAEEFAAENPDEPAKNLDGEWADLGGSGIKIPEQYRSTCAKSLARNPKGERAASDAVFAQAPPPSYASPRITTPAQSINEPTDPFLAEDYPADFPEEEVNLAMLKRQLRKELLQDDPFEFEPATAKKTADAEEDAIASIEIKPNPDGITIEPAGAEDTEQLSAQAGAIGANYEEPASLGGREVSFAADSDWDPRLDLSSGYGEDCKPEKLAINREGEVEARKIGREAVSASSRRLDPAATVRAQKIRDGKKPDRLVLPEEFPAETGYRGYVESLLNPSEAVAALADGTIISRRPDDSILIELPDGRSTIEVTKHGSLITMQPMPVEEIIANRAASRKKMEADLAERAERARPKPIVSIEGTSSSYADGDFPFELSPSGTFYLEKKGDTFLVKDLASGRKIGGRLIDWAGARELPSGYYYLPEKISAEDAVAAIELDRETNEGLADAYPTSNGGLLSWQRFASVQAAPK
jgi:hypothetical protein